MIERDRLVEHLNRLLEIEAIEDFCPNGLQVEGKPGVARVALGVTASLALLEQAQAWNADALIVHHGLFWRNAGQTRLVRSLKTRVKELIEHDTNLLAYHLPLDRHIELGNNAILARLTGADDVEPAFPMNGVTVGVVGRFQQPISAEQMISRVAKATARDPLVVAAGPAEVRAFGVVSGAASGLIEDAARSGLDMFLTGEPKEAATHIAREEGIHFVAAGHHATERFGVKALGEHLERVFGIETRFFEIGNPV